MPAIAFAPGFPAVGILYSDHFMSMMKIIKSAYRIPGTVDALYSSTHLGDNSNLEKMIMKKTLLAALLAMGIASSANAALVYVGSWYVGDGPEWTTNPTVYTAQEAAAFLFGGSASDYSISTVDSNPLNVNYMAFVDGWGDSTYLTTPVSESYSLDSGGPGYNEPFGGPSYSAYVLDHSCFNRYGNPGEVCAAGEPGLNYAFRDVPEPGMLALLGLGFAGLAGIRRRKQA